MTATTARYSLACLLLALSSAAAAADPTQQSPLVTPTDTSHQAANAPAAGNALVMPPGTQGAPPTSKSATEDKRAARPPISDQAPAAPTAASSQATPLRPAAETAVPSTPAPTLADQMALRSMVQATRDSLSESVKPPPAKITVKTGVTEIIPIAIARMNRFLTPFHDPVIKTTSTASITRNGGIVYVATDTAESISMFVMEKSDPEQAISLTLTPASIPPVQVELTLAGYEPKPAPPAERAKDSPGTTPYVEAVKTLMRALALHRIPDGFAMAQINKVPKSDLPRCRLGNVDVHLAQVLEGHSMNAFVARAVNVSIDPTEIEESGCSSDAVLAVAAWPRSHLEPGQDTELYIVVRRHDQGEAPADRPSVLRAGE